MRVEYGQIEGTAGDEGAPWFVRLTGPNVAGGSTVIKQPSEAAARRLAETLAGGRRVAAGVRRVTFPAEAPEAEARIVAAVVATTKAAVATVDAAIDAERRRDAADLVKRPARQAAAEILAGDFDDVLDEVEAAERARKSGPRKTVLKAIGLRGA